MTREELKELKFRHNICGSDAETIDDLIEELKCDNLVLRARLRKYER